MSCMIRIRIFHLFENRNKYKYNVKLDEKFNCRMLIVDVILECLIILLFFQVTNVNTAEQIRLLVELLRS